MISENLVRVQTRMQQAAQRVGRNAAEVTLVGVTKQQPVEILLEGYRAGLQHFGENRVEEIVAKIPSFLQATDVDNPPTIHMIGHLQRRQVLQALQYTQLIHSVDTIRLAERINRLTDQTRAILLECNVSGEASKMGFQVANWEEDETVLDRFILDIQAIAALKKVQIVGLMTMAPFVSDAEAARPHFRSLRKLILVCKKNFPELNWQHLSMGMTNDFEIAIEEGATMVRVGQAIFPRD